MEKKKIIIIIGAVLVIVILSIILFFVKKGNQNPDNKIDGVNSINVNEVIKEQTVDGLKFTKVSLVVIDGETNFYALVSNPGTKDYKFDNLFVNFVGENLDYKILGLTGTEIKSGASMEIRIMIDSDLSATKSVKYIIEK